MSSLLVPGRNCWRVANASSSGLLVDARDYYRAFYMAACKARRHILISGWQFDSKVRLLRGADAEGHAEVELLSFLKWLLHENDELSIYLLAWDYSFVYAREREWLQRLRFDWTTNPRLHFYFDDQHPVGASHHQKFVVVDGQLAFAGGIDLCDARWDDRRHLAHNPDRLNIVGDPQKPYHDLMAYVAGAGVAELAELFRVRWRCAGAGELELAPAPPLPEPSFPGALPFECECVAISRTLGEHEASGTARTEEILALHEDAIEAAEQLIYLETQYFTARGVHKALCARMRQKHKPALDIVVIMPHGADSPKEKMALGAAQDRLLSSLAQTAKEGGHRFGVYYSAVPSDEGEVPVFIHSKLLLVDDRLLSVGSANLTNRSMHVDSELNVSWECATADLPLGVNIRGVRTSLICEHAGIDDTKQFENPVGLVERIDALVSAKRTRLRARDLPESPEAVECDPLLERAFDPDRPLDEFRLDELILLDG